MTVVPTSQEILVFSCPGSSLLGGQSSCVFKGFLRTPGQGSVVGIPPECLSRRSPLQEQFSKLDIRERVTDLLLMDCFNWDVQTWVSGDVAAWQGLLHCIHYCAWEARLWLQCKAILKVFLITSPALPAESLTQTSAGWQFLGFRTLVLSWASNWTAFVSNITLIFRKLYHRNLALGLQINNHSSGLLKVQYSTS